MEQSNLKEFRENEDFEYFWDSFREEVVEIK